MGDRPPGTRRFRRLFCTLLWLLFSPALMAQSADSDIEDDALAFSQSVLGTRPDDISLVDSSGQPRTLSEFRGKPVLVSLVFTACAYACSTTTRHVDRVVREARHALGQKSFSVLTIGFDTPVDSPEAMRAFARRHGIHDPDWHFLSATDAEAMARAMRQFGMRSQPSSRGFDHTVQLSVLDAEGVLYRQVYGDLFSAPQLIEPLKDLVLGRPRSEASAWERLSNRVRLICTVYDPRSGRYYFDYSLFIGIFIGMLFLGSVTMWLLREMRSKQKRQST